MTDISELTVSRAIYKHSISTRRLAVDVPHSTNESPLQSFVEDAHRANVEAAVFNVVPPGQGTPWLLCKLRCPRQRTHTFDLAAAGKVKASSTLSMLLQIWI